MSGQQKEQVVELEIALIKAKQKYDRLKAKTLRAELQYERLRSQHDSNNDQAKLERLIEIRDEPAKTIELAHQTLMSSGGFIKIVNKEKTMLSFIKRPMDKTYSRIKYILDVPMSLDAHNERPAGYLRFHVAVKDPNDDTWHLIPRINDAIPYKIADPTNDTRIVSATNVDNSIFRNQYDTLYSALQKKYRELYPSDYSYPF